MCSLADFQTQILHQQLVCVGRFVREVVQDEGRVGRACVDIEVAEWENKYKALLYVLYLNFSHIICLVFNLILATLLKYVTELFPSREIRVKVLSHTNLSKS